MTARPLIPGFPAAGRRTSDAPSSDVARGGDGDANVDEALGHMEAGRWRQAFVLLAEGADRGHPGAARLALIFVSRGTSLFGGRYCASADQQARWRRACAEPPPGAGRAPR